MRSGWFMNKRHPTLDKKKGLIQQGDRGELLQEVTLCVQQKMYRRKVRGGKFEFHEREYIL